MQEPNAEKLYFQYPSTHNSKSASDIIQTFLKKDGSREDYPAQTSHTTVCKSPNQKTHLCLQQA